MQRKLWSLIVLTLAALLLAACAPAAEPVEPPAVPEMILATTTSTQDSGLLDVLIPLFEEQTGYIVQVVAVGSGAAMTMGQEGNADVLLVHSPAAEETFMADGYGIDRFLVMHNDFIIVGPADDPAGLSGMTVANDAMAAIAESQSTFISRGDDSGTHKAELKLWTNAGITTEGASWYQESGQGMGATLTIASELGAYTLTDRATFLANQASLNLVILVEGDTALLNIYHVITVNPANSTTVAINTEGANVFARFMISDETQEVIGGFGVDTYGQPLFFPDAGKDESDL